jgi:hypothetical protein
MPNPETITRPQAERHEALWLALSALHKDIIALGAKRPDAPVSEPVRIAAEALLCDCAPFVRQRREKLPVAAPDLAGLAVQLGQALATLDAFQDRHTHAHAELNCPMWQVSGAPLPVMRLKPPAGALKSPYKEDDIADIRRKLVIRFDQHDRGTFQRGFAAGLAARQGAPSPSPHAAAPADAPSGGAEPAPAQSYPRIRSFD